MDTQSRWILGVLIALTAVLVTGAVVARQVSPFPEPVTGSSDLVEVALSHEQQRNVTLTVAQAARDGAGGAVPTLVVPTDLGDLDTYEPDTFDDTDREALAEWLLARMVGGNLEYVEYDAAKTPDLTGAPDAVAYPLRVTRVGEGERYILYRGSEPGSVVLIEESLVTVGDSP